jgi:hypothetical protein
MDLVDECPHLVQNGMDPGHDILSVNMDGTRRAIAQRHVKGRPLLRTIDPLSGKHATDLVLETALPGQSVQKPEGMVGNAVFGIIEQQVFERKGKTLKPLGILRK